MKLKVIIIALVALLSGIFFWQTTNRFLYPSRATSSTPVPGTGTAPVPGTGTAGLPATGTASSGTGTNTDSSTPSGCPMRAKGDYNCDGAVDMQDLAVFRHEYSGKATTKESDGNVDGKVDLIDYDALRVNLFR